VNGRRNALILWPRRSFGRRDGATPALDKQTALVRRSRGCANHRCAGLWSGFSPTGQSRRTTRTVKVKTQIAAVELLHTRRNGQGHDRQRPEQIFLNLFLPSAAASRRRSAQTDTCQQLQSPAADEADRNDHSNRDPNSLQACQTRRSSSSVSDRLTLVDGAGWPCLLRSVGRNRYVGVRFCGVTAERARARS